MKKRILMLLLAAFVLMALLAMCKSKTTSSDTESSALESSAAENSESDSSEANSDETDTSALTFTLVAGEQGEYGEYITYNKGTELEEKFYAYYIPSGTYVVINTGEYMSQVNVYSNEKVVTEEGWEEAASTGDVKLIDVGESDTIVVEDGQHIEIEEPSIFQFVQQ